MEKLIKLFEKLKRLSELMNVFDNFKDKFSSSLINSKFYKSINEIKLLSGKLYKNFNFFFHDNPFFILLKSFYTNNGTLGNIFSKVSNAAKKYRSRYVDTISDKKFDIYKQGNFSYKLSKAVSNPNSFYKKIEEREKSFLKGFSPFEIINNIKNKTVNNFDGISQKVITNNSNIIHKKDTTNIMNTVYKKDNNIQFVTENISDDEFDEFGIRLARALKDAFLNKDRAVGY